MHYSTTETLATARRHQFLAEADGRRRAARARSRPGRPGMSGRSLRAVIARAVAGGDRPLNPARAA
jgi:hypothetical protein